MSTAKVESLKMQIFIGKWDITEFVLGGSVSKSLGQPLGQWQLRCRPILQNGRVFDTDQIYPMDYVEIRVGRPKPGETIPILTRGFVSAIDIDDGVSQDLSGSPQRAITISGHDLTKAIVGKMLRNTVDETVGNRNTVDRTQGLINLENFFLKRNARISTLGLSNFVETIMKFIFYDAVTGMQLINNFQFQVKTNLPKKYEAKQIGDGTSSTASDNSIISPDLLNVETVATILNFPGNLWSYLQSYCPKPVIEMFVEDNEENSTFNVRWSPYRTILDWSSKKAADLYVGSRPNEYPKRIIENTESSLEATWFNTLEGPTKSLISINEIMNIKVRRHDNDRFTYFICMYKNWRSTGPAGASIAPNKGDPWRTGPQQYAYDSDPVAESYSNKNYGVNPYYDFPGIAKFGLKSFQFNAPFTPYIIQTTEQKPNADKEMIKLFAGINFWAVQAFAGIDTLYSGMIVMRGCPFVKVGQELYIDRNINSSFQYKDVTKNDEYPNAKTEQYYVESVEHAWQVFPNPQFTTRLGVTRGVNIGKITAPFVEGGSGFTVKTDQTNLYNLTPDQLSKLSSDKIIGTNIANLRSETVRSPTSPAPAVGSGTSVSASAALSSVSSFVSSAPKQVQRTVTTFFVPKPANAVSREIRGVVLHHTGGTTPIACHSAGSWHFLIDRDGTLYKDVPVQDVAFHAAATDRWRPAWVADTCPWAVCSDINTCSIGIEMVSPGSGTATFTENQYDCLKYLAQDIKSQFGDLWWVGHGEIQSDRHDPLNFRWDDFFTQKDSNNGRKWK